MIEIVFYLFALGMVGGFASGLISLQAYFYITDGGIETLYGSNRPNVWKRVKVFRENPEAVEDEKLQYLYQKIYFTRQLGLGLIIFSLLLYVFLFTLGWQ